MVEKARKLMLGGCKSIMIQLPTGGGKTALASSLLKLCAEKNKIGWFNVHRRELIKQSSATLLKFGVDHGIMSAGFLAAPSHNTQINSVQTIVRKLDKLPVPNLIITDEAHHIAAGTWQKIFKQYPNAFNIGLSATPERLDGKGLSDFYEQMICGPSVSWLIKNNYLSSYKYYAPPLIDASSLKITAGDYNKADIADHMAKNLIIGNVVDEYKKHAPGARMLVFAPSIELSKQIVDGFNKAGIKAAHVDGEDNADIRDYHTGEFVKGNTRILSNVDLFGEGYDLPELDAMADLSPTLSLSRFLQKCGRPLRYFPGKTAVIIDMVNNYKTHGFPDDEREWKLTSTKRKKKGEAPVKHCPKCYGAMMVGVKNCTYCGHEFFTQKRDIQQIDGKTELVDVEKERLKKKKEQGSAKTMDELVALGKMRGYKNPFAWAGYVLKSRENKQRK